MCSMAVADGLPAAGLVLISYPLHPPGRPETMRVDHFPRLTVPCLFVSGTRDAFATPAELEAATAAIPAEVTHVWIDGGGHGLRGKDRPVADAVTDWVGGLRG
jgi:predicted alpha/beta-hydrolase family hydrolase